MYMYMPIHILHRHTCIYIYIYIYIYIHIYICICDYSLLEMFSNINVSNISSFITAGIGTKFSMVYQHPTTFFNFLSVLLFLVTFIFFFCNLSGFVSNPKPPGTYEIGVFVLDFFKLLSFCRCNRVAIEIFFSEVFMRCASFFSKNVIVA